MPEDSVLHGSRQAVVMGVFGTMVYTALCASTPSWLRKRSVDEQNNVLSS